MTFSADTQPIRKRCAQCGASMSDHDLATQPPDAELNCCETCAPNAPYRVALGMNDGELMRSAADAIDGLLGQQAMDDPDNNPHSAALIHVLRLRANAYGLSR